jgi:CheY-like chemotaxis protein
MTQSPFAASGERPTVLVVDDDPTISLSTLMLLEQEGFEGIEAASSDQALALVSGGLRPEVVISDYRLPGRDGIEGIRRLRQALGAEIPAILITGDAATPVHSPGLPPNCTVLIKPARPETLGEIVRQALLGGPAQPWG